MIYLLAGLILFLGVHSVHLVASGWRDACIARLGYLRWKGLYSLVSIAGFALIIIGFGIARREAGTLWTPAPGMRHATELLTLIAAILIAATYIPNNPLKARLHHPMVLGAACWALGHLLANGSAADALLFAAFLLWGVISFIVDRRRDAFNATPYPPGTVRSGIITVITGIVIWIVFAFWLHGPLIGVRPFA